MASWGEGSHWRRTERLTAVEEAQEAVEDRQRMRRAAGNKEIDGDGRARAVVDFRAIDVRAARDGQAPTAMTILGSERPHRFL